MFILIIRLILIVFLSPIIVFILIKRKIVKLKINKQDKDKIIYLSASQIDELDGKEFEIMLKNLFEKMGYSVLLTQTSHDFGADLILEKNHKKTLIQAKRYSHNVGIRAVQETIGAKTHYKINNAVIVTNQFFSKEAEQLSDENSIQLVDRNLLLQFITKYDVKITKEKKTYSAMTKNSIVEIETKYPSWI